MNKKYEILEDDFIMYKGKKLYRIKALKQFGNSGADTIITRGELGGYVEGYHNLSQEGNCWISDSAKVYGNARIRDRAFVGNNAKVCGNARVLDNAVLLSTSIVYGNAVIKDDALISQSEVYDNAIVRGDSFISCSRVYGNASIEKKENMTRAKVIESEIHDNANIISEIISHSEICDNAKVSGVSRVPMELVVITPIVYKNKISNNSII